VIKHRKILILPTSYSSDRYASTGCFVPIRAVLREKVCCISPGKPNVADFAPCTGRICPGQLTRVPNFSCGALGDVQVRWFTADLNRGFCWYMEDLQMLLLAECLGIYVVPFHWHGARGGGRSPMEQGACFIWP
jgi:hypothetical protein